MSTAQSQGCSLSSTLVTPEKPSEYKLQILCSSYGDHDTLGYFYCGLKIILTFPLLTFLCTLISSLQGLWKEHFIQICEWKVLINPSLGNK